VCGIAGYSIGSEIAEQFGAERAANIAHDGIMYNRHRGLDAGGWYAQYDEPIDDLYTLVYKRPGDPADSIEEFPQGKPVVMATHTRAATNGRPEILANDHPLVIGDAVVVHNGMVGNHNWLKKDLEDKLAADLKVDKFEFPTVDSSVLAGALHLMVKDWDNKEQLRAFSTFLRGTIGGVAMAASLRSVPGIQLLAKEGISPLVVAIHKDLPIVLWASEEDALFKIMERFNIPQDDYDLGTMRNGHMLVIDHGRVLHGLEWVAAPKYHGYTGGGMSVSRYSPLVPDKSISTLKVFDKRGWLGDWVKPRSVVGWQRPEDYPYRVEPLNIHEALQEPGMNETVRRFMSEATVALMLSEDKNPLRYNMSDIYFYLIFGNNWPLTEIVVNGTGNVQDIHYFQDALAMDFKRWEIVEEKEEEKEEEEEEEDGPLGSFFKRDIVWHQPKNPFDPKDATNRRIVPFEKKQRDACMVQSWQSWKYEDTQMVMEGIRPPNEFSAPKGKRAYRVRNTPYAITVNKWCQKHSDYLSDHDEDDALDCTMFRDEAYVAASMAWDLSILKSDFISDIGLVYNWNVQDIDLAIECQNAGHDFEPLFGQEFDVLVNNTNDNFFLTGELCETCGVVRYIGTDHPWIDISRWVVLDHITGLVTDEDFEKVAARLGLGNQESEALKL